MGSLSKNNYSIVDLQPDCSFSRIRTFPAGEEKWHYGCGIFSGNGTETLQFPEGGDSLFSETTPNRRFVRDGW